MLTPFITTIENYLTKEKASVFNWQLLHHHGATGVKRASLLRDIVVRSLLTGFYEEAEKFLIFYLKKQLTSLYLRELFNKLNIDRKDKSLALECAKLLNGGNNHRSSLRYMLATSLQKNTTISHHDKLLVNNFHIYLDHCILAYKLFSMSLTSPLDPFSQATGNYRQQYIKHLKMISDTPENRQRLDPLEVDIVKVINPNDAIIYTPDKTPELYLSPFYFKHNLIHYTSVIDDGFQMNKMIINPRGILEIFIFSGETGATKNRPNQKQKSMLGFICYNRETKVASVTFRGSRSADAVQALKNGFLYSKGNADWVTDMNVFKIDWDRTKPDYKNVYQKIFSYHQNVGLSHGFAKAFVSALPNITRIVSHIQNHIGRINAFTFTGHSLGAALAQVCYLCFKFGALKKYEQGKEISCYLYSAPPVLTKKSVDDLKLSIDSVYHCYIDTDLVHMIDLQDNLKTYILKTYNKQRTNMGHFGLPLFRLSGSALTPLDFPDSHDYKNFYKLSNANSPVAKIDNKIIINQYPKEFVLHFKIDEIKEGVQLILALRKIKNNVISYLEKADQLHKKLIEPSSTIDIKHKKQLQQQLNLATQALDKLKIKEYCERLSLLSACLEKFR